MVIRLVYIFFYYFIGNTFNLTCNNKLPKMVLAKFSTELRLEPHGESWEIGHVNVMPCFLESADYAQHFHHCVLIQVFSATYKSEVCSHPARNAAADVHKTINSYLDSRITKRYLNSLLLALIDVNNFITLIIDDSPPEQDGKRGVTLHIGSFIGQSSGRLCWRECFQHYFNIICRCSQT